MSLWLALGVDSLAPLSVHSLCLSLVIKAVIFQLVAPITCYRASPIRFGSPKIWGRIQRCSFSREDDASLGVGFEASKDQCHFECQLNF